MVSSIEPKAILAGQVRRGVPAGAVVVMVVAALCLVGFFVVMARAGGGSFVVALLLALITVIPLTAVVLFLDRLNPAPRYLLATSMLWGAGVAVVVSTLLEEWGGNVLRAVTPGGAEMMLMTVVGPIVEEAMKGLVLIGIFMFRRNELTSLTDGIVYAAITALGFAAAENVAYYIGAAASGNGELAGLFLVRGILSPFCHPLFTSMTGIGLVWAANRREAAGRGWLVAGGLFAAMFLHGIWNGATTFGVVGMCLAYLIEAGVMIVLLVLSYKDRGRLVGRVRACMWQYVSTGLVGGSDLDMLTSMKTRRMGREWAMATGGKGSQDAMHDYQAACTKLTLLHDQYATGTMTPQDFVGRRNGLLTLMRVAREAFLSSRYTYTAVAAPQPVYMQYYTGLMVQPLPSAYYASADDTAPIPVVPPVTPPVVTNTANTGPIPVVPMSNTGPVPAPPAREPEFVPEYVIPKFDPPEFEEPPFEEPLASESQTAWPSWYPRGTLQTQPPAVEEEDVAAQWSAQVPSWLLAADAMESDQEEPEEPEPDEEPPIVLEAEPVQPELGDS